MGDIFDDTPGSCPGDETEKLASDYDFDFDASDVNRELLALHPSDDEFPVILDGVTVGRIAAREVLP